MRLYTLIGIDFAIKIKSDQTLHEGRDIFKFREYLITYSRAHREQEYIARYIAIIILARAHLRIALLLRINLECRYNITHIISRVSPYIRYIYT